MSTTSGMKEHPHGKDATRDHLQSSDDDDNDACDIHIPSLFSVLSFVSVNNINNEQDQARKNRNGYDAVWFTTALSQQQHDDNVEKRIFVIGTAETNCCRLVVVKQEALFSTVPQRQQQQQQQIVVQFPETDMIEALCFVRSSIPPSSRPTQKSDETMDRVRLVVLTRAGDLFHASLDRFLNTAQQQGTPTGDVFLDASQVMKPVLLPTKPITPIDTNSPTTRHPPSSISIIQGMSRLVSCDDSMPGCVLVGGSPPCSSSGPLEEPQLFLIQIPPTFSTTKEAVVVPISGLASLSSPAKGVDTAKGGSGGRVSTTSITSLTLVGRSAMEPEFAQSLEQRLWSVLSTDPKSVDDKGGDSKQVYESVSATTTTRTENMGERKLHAFVLVGLRDGTLWASGLSNSEQSDVSSSQPKHTHSERFASVNTCSIMHLIGWLSQEQSLIDVILTRSQTGLFNGLLCVGAHGDVAHMASNGTTTRLKSLEEVGQWASAFPVYPWKDKSTMSADGIMVWTTNQVSGTTHLQYWELSTPIGHDNATSSSSSIVPIRSDLEWTMPIRAVGEDGASQIPVQFFLGKAKQGTLVAFEVPNNKYALQDWLSLNAEEMTEKSVGAMPRGTLRQLALKNKSKSLNGHDSLEADSRKRIKRYIRQCAILDATQSSEMELTQRREHIQKMSYSNLAILRVQQDATTGNALAIEGGIETTGSNRVARVQLQEDRRGTSSLKDLAATLHVCDAQASDTVCARRAHMDVHYGGIAFSSSTVARSNKNGDASSSQTHRFSLPVAQNTTASTYLSLVPDYLLAMDYQLLVHPVSGTEHQLNPKSHLGEVMVVAEQILDQEI